METSLRPMTLGEILDRTAQLYRAHFVLFAGIASVYAGAILVMGLAETGLAEWLRAIHMTRALLWTSGVSVGVMYILMFIFGGIAGAANNRAVAWVHLGEPATIRGAYRSILPKFWRYLWLGFLKLVFAWSPVIVIYGSLIGTLIYMRVKHILPQPGAAAPAGAAANGGALIVVGLVFVGLGLLLLPAVAYGVVMGLRYALAVPACVVEDLKARPSIRRSIQLSNGSRGRIFMLGLLVLVIEIGLVAVTQSFFIWAAVKNHQELPILLRVLQQIVSFCTTSFVTPILSTGMTLFYYDQRVRKEGYDIEWMMQAAGLAPGATLTHPTSASSAETTGAAAPATAAEAWASATTQLAAVTPGEATAPAPEPGTAHE